MDFRTFVQTLLTRWKLVAAALLACLAGAAAVTIFQNKAYQSSATVLISIAGATDVTEVYWAGRPHKTGCRRTPRLPVGVP
ncbi:chain length determinant family protein [Mycobacterium kansasii]|uniref:Chain length determinant family protein n=1 Tax=Mycobacterium kansasii TaxID=1768 RepID=A0A1V3XK25_MYCKA|nr:chain length determinant family protein [Mycobacterium kansasii]